MELIFGEAFDIDPKVTIRRGSHVPFVEMADVKPWTRTAHAVTHRAFSSGSKFIDSDVLLARITPSLENGKTSIYRAAPHEMDQPAAGSTEFIVIRGKRGVSLSEYAYYLLRTHELRSYLIANMNGSSGRQRVRAEALHGFPIALPDISAQKRTVELLSLLDDKIESNHQAARESEALAFALFEKLATAEIRFNDIARVVMGASPPGSSYNEAGDGVPFFQGVRDFTFRFPKRRVFTSMPKHLAAPGDILLSVRAPVGRLNVAVDQCCIGRGLAAIRSEVSSTCYYALRNMDTEWKKYEAQGTVFGSLNKASLKALKLPWPEPSMIKLLESHLNTLDSYISQKEQESRKLAELRDTLLPELISGRMRVDEAGHLVADMLGEESIDD